MAWPIVFYPLAHLHRVFLPSQLFLSGCARLWHAKASQLHRLLLLSLPGNTACVRCFHTRSTWRSQRPNLINKLPYKLNEQMRSTAGHAGTACRYTECSCAGERFAARLPCSGDMAARHSTAVYPSIAGVGVLCYQVYGLACHAWVDATVPRPLPPQIGLAPLLPVHAPLPPAAPLSQTCGSR